MADKEDLPSLVPISSEASSVSSATSSSTSTNTSSSSSSTTTTTTTTTSTTSSKMEDHPNIISKPPTLDGPMQNIETGDSLKVKQVLDTSVLDYFRDSNYSINYRSENIKILIMVIACGFALLGQFNPLPFPENRWILCLCCVIYFSLNSLLAVVTFYDGETIVLTNKNDSETLPSLQIDASFHRFQEFYVLTIREYSNNKLKGNSDDEKKIGAEGQMYVGKYFKSTGDFLENVFRDDVYLLIDRFKKARNDKKFEKFEYNHKN